MITDINITINDIILYIHLLNMKSINIVNSPIFIWVSYDIHMLVLY
jgi:hypothetical protein